MRIALIADIHGNRLALEAVLADIAAEKPDAIVNLGDNFSGPMDPAGVARILRDLDAPTVRGNHDRYLAEGAAGATLGPVDRFALDTLSEADRAWNNALSLNSRLDDVLFVCHGTPESDEDFWLERWEGTRGSVMPDETEVAGLARGIDFPLLACGHTHRPRVARLVDGRLIVNPGSVGLQFVHGSPEARYALLDKRGDDWSVTHRTIPYDAEGAARQAEANGFAQWRAALTTGWPGPQGLF